MFGGGIKYYKVQKQRFAIFHWTVAGDRGRVFLSAIYPYLTERRREQIQRTTAWEFVEPAQEIVNYSGVVRATPIIEMLWNKIGERNEAGHIAARQHNLARHREFDRQRERTPEQLARRNELSRDWKRRKRAAENQKKTKLVVMEKAS